MSFILIYSNCIYDFIKTFLPNCLVPIMLSSDTHHFFQNAILAAIPKQEPPTVFIQTPVIIFCLLSNLFCDCQPPIEPTWRHLIGRCQTTLERDVFFGLFDGESMTTRCHNLYHVMFEKFFKDFELEIQINDVSDDFDDFRPQRRVDGNRVRRRRGRIDDWTWKRFTVDFKLVAS